MKVLRFAQEIDHNAQRFYEKMATRNDNPGGGRIFRMLAEDEGLLLNRHKTLAKRGDSFAAEAHAHLSQPLLGVGEFSNLGDYQNFGRDIV